MLVVTRTLPPMDSALSARGFQLASCSSIVTFPPNLTHFEDQIRIVDKFIEFIKFHTFPLNIFKLFSDVFPQTLSDFPVVGVLKD